MHLDAVSQAKCLAAFSLLILYSSCCDVFSLALMGPSAVEPFTAATNAACIHRSIFPDTLTGYGCRRKTHNGFVRSCLQAKSHQYPGLSRSATFLSTSEFHV